MLDAVTAQETKEEKQSVLLLWRGLRLEVCQLLFSHIAYPGSVGRPYRPALTNINEITKGDRISSREIPGLDLRITSKAEAHALTEALRVAASLLERRQHFAALGQLPPDSPPATVEIVAEQRSRLMRWRGPRYAVRATIMPEAPAL